jgi:homopolymeric O-antigen transport system permease protein
MFKELMEAVRYRYVIYNFVYSSLKQRYTRSFLGFLWSIITPLLQNLIVGIVFYYLMRMNMPNYIVYLFAGSIIFNIMSNVIMQAPMIMISNEGFIKKIYVPKLVFVLQTVFLEVTNFVFTIISLIILGIIFQKLTASPYDLFLIVPIMLTVLFLTGLAIIISILTVYFRDMAYIISLAMQALFFLTPILYPISIVPVKLRKILALNPLYYFVEIFRSTILYNQFPRAEYILMCSVMAFAAFFFGLFMLHKFDNRITFKL